jgi:hypothetical protein
MCGLARRAPIASPRAPPDLATSIAAHCTPNTTRRPAVPAVPVYVRTRCSIPPAQSRSADRSERRSQQGRRCWVSLPRKQLHVLYPLLLDQLASAARPGRARGERRRFGMPCAHGRTGSGRARVGRSRRPPAGACRRGDRVRADCKRLTCRPGEQACGALINTSARSGK